MTDNPDDKRRSGRIADYEPLIQDADGLTLGQVCSLSGLEPSTIQNWIKRGFVPHPERKKYRERHLARILLISQLRESMQIDRVGALLSYINGDTDDESDDLITEQALYDLFCELTLLLDRQMPPPDKVGQTVDEIAAVYLSDYPAPEKIICALRIMACTYMASRYKQEADTMYTDMIQSES